MAGPNIGQIGWIAGEAVIKGRFDCKSSVRFKKAFYNAIPKIRKSEDEGEN